MEQITAREHSLQTAGLAVGDIYTESITGTGDQRGPERKVVIDTAPVLTEMFYRGEYVPVYFVRGTDPRNHQVVKTMASPRRRWSVTRMVVAFRGGPLS